MAIYCNNCRYIYHNDTLNCPHCGARLNNDATSEQELFNQGFLIEPRNRRTSHGSNFFNRPSSFANTAFEINDKDIFDSLRTDYTKQQQQQQQQQQTNHNSSNPEMQQQDYFSQFNNVHNTHDSIPEVNPDIQYQDTFDEETEALERQRRQINRRYRHTDFLNTLIQIPWGVIFRLLLIVLIACVIIGIWQMRFIIVSSILNFLISLLPIVFLIGAIAYILRSIFR